VTTLRSISRCLSVAAAVCTLSVALPLTHQLSAQPAASSAKAKSGAAKGAAPPSLVGTWSGTATVPLKDSSIVVPVTYNFTQTAGTLGGMAMVPGQGSGPISNVVRDGARVQFRVTAPEGKLLEHDGKLGADGAIEGLVNLDKLPVAKFRIVAKAGATPGK
jgi:hypothetical protein